MEANDEKETKLNCFDGCDCPHYIWIKGTMDPVPGHSFPKSWGRVVTYFVQPTGAGHRFLVFEAADGTIRMVRVDLDWDKHRIEDADVITIGRD